MGNDGEVRCEACEGTGFPRVKQPSEPGKRIYPPCKKCGKVGCYKAEGGGS
jgi:hypothetical protein